MSGQRKTILIIEDNILVRRTLKQLIQDGGFDVLESADSQEGLELLYQSVLPDLILMDLLLPGKDGDQFIKELQTHPSFKKIPIVVISGYIGTKFAPPAGVKAVIEKPIRNDDLLRIIKDSIG